MRRQLWRSGLDGRRASDPGASDARAFGDVSLRAARCVRTPYDVRGLTSAPKGRATPSHRWASVHDWGVCSRWLNAQCAISCDILVFSSATRRADRRGSSALKRRLPPALHEHWISLPPEPHAGRPKPGATSRRPSARSHSNRGVGSRDRSETQGRRRVGRPAHPPFRRALGVCPSPSAAWRVAVRRLGAPNLPIQRRCSCHMMALAQSFQPGRRPLRA